MSVEIDPQELGFHRPFTSEVSEVLKIKNPNSTPVAFKVKTTAPKQYCVRPNSGRVEPGKEVEVQVILQAMKQEPPMDTKCRDKFLVQSVAISSDKEFSNLAAIWDGIDKSQVQEKKIRVVFLAPGGASHSSGAEPMLATPHRASLVNGHEDTPEAPPAYQSPTDYARASPVSKSESKHEDEAASASAAGGVAAVVSAKASETYEELKSQLSQAQQTIAQLQKDGASGLRQRKATSSDSAASSSQSAQLGQQVRQATEGVPVKITAILCLVSFLLAYLFF